MNQKCRSCGARLLWAITTANGRRIPLDIEPRADGNLHVTFDAKAGQVLASYIGQDSPNPPPASQRYVAHFATCPTRRPR